MQRLLAVLTPARPTAPAADVLSRRRAPIVDSQYDGLDFWHRVVITTHTLPANGQQSVSANTPPLVTRNDGFNEAR